MTYGIMIIDEIDLYSYEFYSHFEINSNQDYDMYNNTKVISTQLLYTLYGKSAFIIDTTEELDWNYAIVACLETYKDSYPTVDNETDLWVFPKHNTIDILSKKKSAALCYLQNPEPENLNIKTDYIELTISEAGFLILLMLIVIYFRNEEPLSTRGHVPFISLVLQCFIVLNALLYDFEFDKFYRYGCFVDSIILIPSKIVLVYLLLLNNIRYVMILNLNKNKLHFHQNSNKTSIHIKSLRFFKKVTSDISTVLSTIIVYLLVIAIQLWIYTFIYIWMLPKSSTSSFECHIYLTPYFEYIIAMLYFFVILVSLVDIASNFKRIFCKPFDFWFKSDPFAMRIQQFFIVFIIVSYFVRLVFVITSRIISGNVDAKKPDERETLEIIQYRMFEVGATVNYIAKFFELFYFSVFILLVTLFRYFKRRILNYIHKPVEPKRDVFEGLMNDQNIYTMFFEFCKSEWSIENLLFYDDALKYSKIPVKEREKHAKRIIELYLNGTNSELEVNATRKECDDFKENVKEGNLDPVILQSLIRTVIVNLVDTFSRFVITTEYINYKKTVNFIEQQK
eukprot:gene5518-9335_t